MTDLNKRFCKLAGINQYKYDKLTRSLYEPIDYASDPIAVLKVMKSRSNWYEFYQYLNQPAREDWVVYMLDTTGLLRDEAIAFLEESYEGKGGLDVHLFSR